MCINATRIAYRIILTHFDEFLNRYCLVDAKTDAYSNNVSTAICIFIGKNDFDSN